MTIEKIDSLKLANSIPSENDKTNMIAKLVCETADMQREIERLDDIIDTAIEYLTKCNYNDLKFTSRIYDILLNILKGSDKE